MCVWVWRTGITNFAGERCFTHLRCARFRVGEEGGIWYWHKSPSTRRFELPLINWEKDYLCSYGRWYIYSGLDVKKKKHQPLQVKLWKCPLKNSWLGGELVFPLIDWKIWCLPVTFYSHNPSLSASLFKWNWILIRILEIVFQKVKIRITESTLKWEIDWEMVKEYATNYVSKSNSKKVRGLSTISCSIVDYEFVGISIIIICTKWISFKRKEKRTKNRQQRQKSAGPNPCSKRKTKTPGKDSPLKKFVLLEAKFSSIHMY